MRRGGRRRGMIIRCGGGEGARGGGFEGGGWLGFDGFVGYDGMIELHVEINGVEDNGFVVRVVQERYKLHA